jgi:electron transfer flavoprotein alpha subunit
MRARRDPRAARLARLVPGDKRPRYGLAPAAQPSSRPRRDPRALRRAALVAGDARPRIDWHVGKSGAAIALGAAEATARTASAPQVRIIAEPAFIVLTVPDQPGGALSEHDRELIGAARQFADAGGGAVVVLTMGAAGDLGAAGADRALSLPASASGEYDPEGRAAAVLAAIDALKPRHVLFPESAYGGADLARRVAALAAQRLFAGAEMVSAQSVSRRMRGGGMEMVGQPSFMMSINEGAAPAHEGVRYEAGPLEAPEFTPTRKIEAAAPLRVDTSFIALSDADFILSGGNGVTDWAGFADLGKALSATIGGSRVVCDEGHLPRDRQVGASGSVVTARCYLAFGIAGAPQHLQGITEVKHVVAINTDLHAEMIKRADLAIIADAQEVMPALIAHARAAGGLSESAATNADGPLSPRERGPEATFRKSGEMCAKATVAVLLSVGRHPASGRARRAPLDARALEMALSIPGAEIHAIHAGDPTEPALRDYLGMGLERLTVLAVPQGSDPVPTITDHLKLLAPDVILCGGRAERGEQTGMVPYLVAEALGFAMVPDLTAIDIDAAKAALTQALPRGKRRLVETRTPVVATVSMAAPAPRQVAFARARRGIIDTVTADAPADSFLAAAEIRPWRPRPKRMRLAAATSAADRLKAMTETKSGEGALMINPSPQDAARVIYDYLLEKRIIEDRP